MDEEKCDFWIGLFLTANENIFLDLYAFLYAKTGLVKMESQAQKTVHPENRYLNGFSDTISPKIAS
ncbi:hypothetical protein ABMX86_21385 [Vibrio vulnificus]|uniref:hypothetical protein n=1 Tax=Vibrio vulnificus TaxID=672 RepID=UPI003EDB5DE1